MKPRILRCITVNPEMKRRYGNDICFEETKAKRMEKKGYVRIVGEYNKKKEEKYKVTPRKKEMYKRVDVAQVNGMKIPVIIPYAPQGRIGQAYNEVMINSIEDWVIFIDHDVLLVNPLWYDICVEAINKVGHSAGWISCYTNRIGCKFQKAPRVDTRSDDIRYHREYARQLYQNNHGKIKNLTGAKGGRFSGMFILTHKQAWLDAGGFNEHIGFFNVDCKYFTAIKNAGYQVYIMQDLYVYHGYFREVLKPFFKKEEHGSKQN